MPSASPSAGSLEHPRLDELLETWARYMRAHDVQDLMIQMSQYWASGSSDFDSMVAAADMADAIATHAAINDLVPVEYAAICHMHLNAVWRANREPIETAYLRARGSLSEGLRLRKVS